MQDASRLAPLVAVKLYHLVGYDFRDLRSGKVYYIYYDNHICIKNNTEYYLMVDECGYIVSAIPVIPQEPWPVPKVLIKTLWHEDNLLTTFMQLKDVYDEAKQRFRVFSSLWSVTHLTFSPYTFCGVNKKELVFEYLFWESLIPQMKDENLPYYQGIDTFLQEYKKAVYNYLNMDTLGA